MANYKANEEEQKMSSGYEIDGFWYPRVTKIVGIKAKPALYHFYAKMQNFAEGERIKQQSAKEGTLIHETIEDILLGKEPDIPESIEPSIRAFQEFIEKEKITVDKDCIERRLVNHEHRFAGTLDAIAMIGGRLGVLDIKTSQEIYRDYDLQTSAYFATMRDSIKGLDARWILRIDQARKCKFCDARLRSKGGKDQVKIPWNNGNWMQAKNCNHEWKPLEGFVELKESPDWESDFSAFLGAKKLWEWENEKWLKEIGYLP